MAATGAGGTEKGMSRGSAEVWYACLLEAATLRVWISDVEEDDPPKLRTVGKEAERLRVIVPSSARPTEAFPVRIVSLDEFWNLSSSTYRGGALARADGEIVEQNIAFTGAYTTYTSLEEEGVHRLVFEDTVSHPIRITERPQGPHWGDLHSHDKTHNCGAGEDPYTYAREVSVLDFVAVTPDFRGLSSGVWQAHKDRADEWYEAGEFTTIIGYEAGLAKGHHNVYFEGGEGPLVEPRDLAEHSIDEILEGIEEREGIAVPHHLGIDWCTQSGYSADRDPWIPLVEIYSQHGQSECYAPEHALSYEFNRTRGAEDKYAGSVDAPVYARDAWSQGRKYGVIASSDDHMAQPGKPVKGLAAVFAEENTWPGIFSALKARRTYGTTGERILLDFEINGAAMGGELSVDRDDELHFDIEVHGTGPIAVVEVMEYRFDEGVWRAILSERLPVRELFGLAGMGDDLDYEAQFETIFAGDAVYYLRVAQKLQIADWPVFAWSSPIWVNAR